MPEVIYIVCFDTTMDNVVYHVTSDLNDAKLHAKNAPDRVPESLLKVYWCDESEVVCISILTVKNGVPVHREIVRDLDF